MTNRIFVLCVLCTALTASAQSLRVGRAEVVISPPEGAPMAGYYATRLSTGVHDDLYSKAIVLESGGVKSALVVCDLVALPPVVIEQARQIAESQTGIPQTNIMISATHSHTGPLMSYGGSRESAYGADLPIARQYMVELPKKIAQSIAAANRGLEPATVSFAKGHEESVNFNRRFFMKDGTVGWNPGKLNPNIVKAAGPIDPDVNVLYFESASEKPLATYVNFALHLDTVGGTDVSADFPATLSAILRKVKGNDMVTVFANGACGNINHIDVSTKTPQKGNAEAERIGTILAGEVIKTYARLKPMPEGKIAARSRTVQLQPAPLKPGDAERSEAFLRDLDAGRKVSFLDTVFAFKVADTVAKKGKPLEAEVQVITFGKEIAWVALPGEVFTELGKSIQQSSPYPVTLVVELAHGPVTYLPNEGAFPQGNYEPVSSRAAPGSGEVLVRTAKELLAEAYAGAGPGRTRE